MSSAHTDGDSADQPDDADDGVPSAAEYRAALESLAPLSPKMLTILRHHHSAPGRTATVAELARVAGYDSHRSGAALYGMLARAIGVAMGRSRERIGLLVTFTTPRPRGDDHWELSMRPEWELTLQSEVAEALEALGWCSSKPATPEEEAPNLDRGKQTSR